MSGAVHTLCKKRIVGGQVRKAVLLLLADYASPNGEGVWVSKMTVAAQLEMSRRSVQNAIQDLCEMGVLVEVGSRGRSNGYTVEYRIDLGVVSALPSTKDDEQIIIQTTCAPASHVQEVHMTCAGGAHQSVQEVHTNLNTTSIKPLELPPLSPKGEKPRRRKCSLPPDWIPNDRNIEDAQARQFSAEEITHEAAQFRDYHLANASTFADWDAAWRTWLGNARKFAAQRPRNSGRGNAYDALLAGFQRAADRRSGRA